MASIFDQYEQATKSPSFASASSQQPAQPLGRPPVSSGFISSALEEESRIFTRQRINFTPPRPITHMSASNNTLMIAMSDNTVLRIDRDHPDQPTEVKISEDKIHKMFLDPTGQHLIISTESQDVLYLGKRSRKAKQLPKMKGHLIDSVGWLKTNVSDITTAEILLGTSRGYIMETIIQSSDDSRFFSQSLEQYWKQVFNLGKEGTVPVTGLEVERIPGASSSDRRFFIMATTPGRMYQFVGSIPSSADPPIYSHVFQKYEESIASFVELPGNFGYSELHTFYPKVNVPIPSSFAWMAGPGVYYGGFDFRESERENLTKDSKLLVYPMKEKDASSRPIAMALTEFHVLLLFKDRVQIICVLNEQPIDDDTYPLKYGPLLGMCRDHTKGTIWTYTDQSVFMYKIMRETRNIWRIFLEQGEFDRAREYCRDNPAQLDEVLSKQAQHFFDKKLFDKSALYFASTQKSFEEVTLKFIEAGQLEALRIFLQKKMASLKPKDKAQMTMLIMWLIELFLNHLGNLRNKPDCEDQYKQVHEEFQKFLAQTKVMECLNSNVNTVYDLIASHGDVTDVVYFAMLMKDYERVISHHIQQDNYPSALDVLKTTKNSKLLYKFSPVLMQHIPHELVTTWIELGSLLDPSKLIPALVQYTHSLTGSKVHEGIRYLEFCVTKLRNTQLAIHNYLLSLYAKEQPNELIKYLNQEGQNADSVHYDLKYALRLCSEHKLNRACVHIYTTMGLYEEAVDLALKVDVDLAKQCAEKPDEDDDLKRKLWLQIAKHVVKEQSNIQKAMEVLQECPLLKIEDVLPFFPDFVTIDHFKEAICDSLKDYNEHIKTLKGEMEEASESAQAIRADIQEMRNKYAIVNAQQKCAKCGSPLLTRSFYLFPCQHMFHSDCLLEEVIHHLIPSKRIRLSELEQQISSLQNSTLSSSSRGRSASSSDATLKRDELNALKNQMDDIVAAECVYCGDIMIRSVDKPFIEPEEWERSKKIWE